MKSERLLQNQKQEVILPATTVYRYQSPTQANEVYTSLGVDRQLEMANIYRSAFAGPPWYESFRCYKCGSFQAFEGGCTKCGSEVGEAYPTQELIYDYFPQMLSQYSPGVLILLAKVGFVTGGMVELWQLIDRKYGGKKEISESIMVQAGIGPRQRVFYDNEACVLPNAQNSGVGKKLSLARVEAAIESGADVVTGRTINQPWLALKRRQWEAKGFSFSAFVPRGDDYEVQGAKRYFFVAKKLS